MKGADIIVLKDLETHEFLSGFHGKIMHGDNVTQIYWRIEKGGILPEHSHVHEQVVNMIKGEFEMTVDGRTIVCKSGQVLVIPSNAIHSGKALTDCEILDVFTPVREDYRQKYD